MRPTLLPPLAFAILSIAGCEPATTLPTESPAANSTASVATPWGPEHPPFNLEAVLRSPSGGAGFGLVRFRQPNGGGQVVDLDT
jgi:hypothetical protein